MVVEIRDRHGASLYELITPDMAPRIIASHVDDERPLRQWLAGKDTEDFRANQKVYITELVAKSTPCPGKNTWTTTATRASGRFLARGSTPFCRKWWPRAFGKPTGCLRVFRAPVV